MNGLLSLERSKIISSRAVKYPLTSFPTNHESAIYGLRGVTSDERRGKYSLSTRYCGGAQQDPLSSHQALQNMRILFGVYVLGTSRMIFIVWVKR